METYSYDYGLDKICRSYVHLGVLKSLFLQCWIEEDIVNPMSIINRRVSEKINSLSFME